MNNERNQIITHEQQMPGTLNMTVNYATLKKRLEELQMFVREYMVNGEDFGVIEGTNKPTLYKSGAEKLCDVYGLAAGQPIVEKIRDDSKDPVYIHYQVTMPLVSRVDGRIIMHGVGSCNSYEKKYKWRWIFESELPPGVQAGRLKSRQVGKQKQYTQYQIPNDEIDDLDNTFLKMAKKRAFVDAVLSATRSSALFTQDVEDFSDHVREQQQSHQENRYSQRQERAGENQQSNANANQDTPPPSQAQVNYIHKLKSERNISDEDLAEMIQERYNKTSVKELTKREASNFIDSLNGKG